MTCGETVGQDSRSGSLRRALLAVGALVLLAIVCARVGADDERDESPGPAERAAAIAKADALKERMKALYSGGRFDEAVEVAREVLELRERALGPDHADVAGSLNDLAAALFAAGRNADALPLLERSLRIRETTLGAQHPFVAATLNNLGTLYRAQGLYTDAIRAFERMLDIYDEMPLPPLDRLATCLNNLGVTYDDLGDLGEARKYYEKALALWEQTLGPVHERVASGLHNIAGLLARQGAYEEALPMEERALRIFQEVLGADHPDTAYSLSGLAMDLMLLGHNVEALPLAEQALEIREQALGNAHPLVASSLDLVADVLCGAAQFEQARPLYEKALEIRETALGADHPSVANSLSNLASTLLDLGQPDEAFALMQRALAIRTRVLGEDSPQLASLLSNMGETRRVSGRFEQARELYERAVAILERRFEGAHPDLAVALNNLALAHYGAKRYEKALEIARRAMRMREELLGPEHLDVAQSVNNVATILRALKREREARPLMERVLDIVALNIRRNFAGSQALDRLFFMERVRGYVDAWVQVAPRIGESGYEQVLRFKGIVARASQAERRLERRAGPEAMRRVQALRVAERRLARLVNSVPSAFPREGREERRNAWKAAYGAAAAERNELAETLARDYASLREGLERLEIRPADLRARLGADVGLVDVLRSGERYHAWVLRAGNPVRHVDLGKASGIETAAATFARSIAEGAADDVVAEAGATLRAAVWEPLADALGEGVKTIYLCPDAALATVPYAALPGRTAGRYLLDEVLLVTLTMAQDLVAWADAPTPGAGVLLLGGVDYEHAGASVRTPEEGTARRALVDRAPRGSSFVPLPDTRVEVIDAAGRFGDAAEVLLSTEATEARFREAAHGRRILHIATHGFARDDLLRGLTKTQDDGDWLGAEAERQIAKGHDPMLLAGLAFAGANPREGGQGDDGILTALEASHLDLDGVDLVVLSACETALGRAESGEGVLGLVQGFQMAGARHVIGSLWKVSDEATRLLMQRFYEVLLQEGSATSPAEALRAAALHVRETRGEGGRSFAHPRYWAAFVAYD